MVFSYPLHQHRACPVYAAIQIATPLKLVGEAWGLAPNQKKLTHWQSITIVP
jgi:hypothetical protein